MPFLILAMTGSIVGCTASGGGSGSDTPGALPSSSSSPTASGSSASPDGLPDDLRAAILADATAFLDVDASTVSIVSAEAVTWNDGSLGCPKRGVVYIQMLIDGFRVIVGAGDQQLDYRTGRKGEFKRCEGFQPGGASG